MKYSMNNLHFEAHKEMAAGIEKIEIEYNLEELVQMAMNFKTILDTIKETVKELTPIISNEIRLHEDLRRSYNNERDEAEERREERRMKDWREKEAAGVAAINRNFEIYQAKFGPSGERDS